ncbi:hypothetical protein [Phenylobacterium sp.]|uniref:hypothetical protein n=1 Tax=Phenylobacterium sp. TaxID=1871053 RepID=UPI002811FDDD|nr:hypothetical protein [Phenylobacterium sp.]
MDTQVFAAGMGLDEARPEALELDANRRRAAALRAPTPAAELQPSTRGAGGQRPPAPAGLSWRAVRALVRDGLVLVPRDELRLGALSEKSQQCIQIAVGLLRIGATRESVRQILRACEHPAETPFLLCELADLARRKQAELQVLGKMLAAIGGASPRVVLHRELLALRSTEDAA